MTVLTNSENSPLPVKCLSELSSSHRTINDGHCSTLNKTDCTQMALNLDSARSSAMFDHDVFINLSHPSTKFCLDVCFYYILVHLSSSSQLVIKTDCVLNDVLRIGIV